MLKGECYAGLHPRVHDIFEQLVLKISLFGTGWLFNIDHSQVKLDNITDNSHKCMDICYTRISDVNLIALLTSDSLGVDIPAKCNKCRSCNNCSHLNERFSWQGQYENELIDKGLQYDNLQQKWIVTYPYCLEPDKLIDN